MTILLHIRRQMDLELMVFYLMFIQDEVIWLTPEKGRLMFTSYAGNKQSHPQKLADNLIIVKVKSLSHVRLFATPWTVAYKASPSMGFSRQE